MILESILPRARLLRAFFVVLLIVPATGFSADFHTAHAPTKLMEGGYVDHPDDRGGETYFGIARTRWPQWQGWSLIDAEISQNGRVSQAFNRRMAPMVEEFYRINFWNRIKGDQIADQDVATQLYDIAVNQGTRTAGCYLQRAVNALNRGGRDYPDLRVDCRIGPATLRAASAYLEKRSRVSFRLCGRMTAIGGKWILMGAIAHQKHRRWADLSVGDRSQESFTNGWAVRGLQEIADVLHNAGATKC